MFAFTDEETEKISGMMEEKTPGAVYPDVTITLTAEETDVIACAMLVAGAVASRNLEDSFISTLEFVAAMHRLGEGGELALRNKFPDRV